jgi:hypothetical protein
MRLLQEAGSGDEGESKSGGGKRAAASSGLDDDSNEVRAVFVQFDFVCLIACVLLDPGGWRR